MGVGFIVMFHSNDPAPNFQASGRKTVSANFPVLPRLRAQIQTMG